MLFLLIHLNILNLNLLVKLDLIHSRFMKHVNLVIIRNLIAVSSYKSDNNLQYTNVCFD